MAEHLPSGPAFPTDPPSADQVRSLRTARRRAEEPARAVRDAARRVEAYAIAATREIAAFQAEELVVEPRVKLGTLCRAMTQLVRRAERSAAAGVRATCLLEADAAACAALYYLRVARRGAQEGANLLEEIRSTLVTLTRNSFVEGQPSAISLDEALDSSNGHRHFS